MLLQKPETPGVESSAGAPCKATPIGDLTRCACATEPAPLVYRSQLINKRGGEEFFEKGREGWKTKRGGKF